MREIFQQELADIGDDLLALGQRVGHAVDTATRALQEADLQLAEEVIDDDRQIDLIEERIETACLNVLALQAPVATDLRLVVSAMRMSATLERMGDLASHVAYTARARFPHVASSGAMLDVLARMAQEAREITALLVKLMEERDLELVSRIHSKDDRLDMLLRQVFDLLLVEETPLTRQELVDAVLLSRFLERLGDHCVAAAKRVAYLVTGNLDASALVEDPTSTDD